MRILLSGTFFIIQIFASAQGLTAEEIMKLVPNQIPGYKQTEGARGNQIQIGDISYSICQKGFSSGSKHITILLFDFKNAPIMYRQVTKEWARYQPMVSDSLTLTPISEANYFGWETTYSFSRSSKIFLGISERFYLAIDGKNVDPTALRDTLKLLSLENFPN